MYQSSKIFNNGSVGSIKRTMDHMKLSQNNKTNLHGDSNLHDPQEKGITLESEYITSVDYESYLRGSLVKLTQNLN